MDEWVNDQLDQWVNAKRIKDFATADRIDAYRGSRRQQTPNVGRH